MKCSEIEILLPEFISGELKNEFESVSNHLKNCRNCNQLKLNIEQTFNVLEKVEIIENPSEIYFNNFLPRLRERIDLKNQKIGFSISKLFPGFVISGLLILFYFSFKPIENRDNLKDLNNLEIVNFIDENEDIFYTDALVEVNNTENEIVDYIANEMSDFEMDINNFN